MLWRAKNGGEAEALVKLEEGSRVLIEGRVGRWTQEEGVRVGLVVVDKRRKESGEKPPNVCMGGIKATHEGLRQY